MNGIQDPYAAVHIGTLRFFVLASLILFLLMSSNIRYARSQYKHICEQINQSHLSPQVFLTIESFNSFWNIVCNAQHSHIDISQINTLLTYIPIIKVDSSPVATSNRYSVHRCSLTSVRGDLDLPDNVPLMFCHYSGIHHEEDFFSLLAGLKVGRPKRIAILFVLGELGAYDWDALIARARRLFAFDLVHLTQHDIRNLIKSPRPIEIFRRLIIHQINLDVLSPFKVTGPTNEKMFFGREEELRWVENEIESSSFIFLGGRRIGKTSLLLHLHRNRFPNFGIHSIYIDCSILSNHADFMATPTTNWLPNPNLDKPEPKRVGLPAM